MSERVVFGEEVEFGNGQIGIVRAVQDDLFVLEFEGKYGAFQGTRDEFYFVDMSEEWREDLSSAILDFQGA